MRIPFFSDMTLRPIAQELNPRIEDAEIRSWNGKCIQTCRGVKRCLQTFRIYDYMMEPSWKNGSEIYSEEPSSFKPAEKGMFQEH
jgi:hypothetical protein